jgi:hypothetical protein
LLSEDSYAPLFAGEARWARVAAGELGRLTQGGVGNAARYIRAPGEGCSRFLRHGFTRRVLAVSYRHGADPVVWRHARYPIVVCARAVQKIRAKERFFRAGCDEIEPEAQRRHVDALEYPRQEKASTVERGGHRVLGSEANISAIGCSLAACRDQSGFLLLSAPVLFSIYCLLEYLQRHCEGIRRR